MRNSGAIFDTVVVKSCGSGGFRRVFMYYSDLKTGTDTIEICWLMSLNRTAMMRSVHAIMRVLQTRSQELVYGGLSCVYAPL